MQYAKRNLRNQLILDMLNDEIGRLATRVLSRAPPRMVCVRHAGAL
jgi:hypothetical protein